MELRMTTDLAQAIPAVLDFNFDELKGELTERLHHYNTLVVTEDAIQEAKTDRANLRKLRDTIDTRRKEIKKQYNAPLAVFESQIKEITALIDAPIDAIDGQVKNFEQQQRDQKMAEIAAAYDEIIPEEAKEIIPLNRILDQRWLNKSTTMKSVRERLSEIAKRVKVDMTLIDGVMPKYKAAVRAKFIETLDVATALDYQDELMAAEERFRQQEEAQAQRNAERMARAQYEHQPENKPPVDAQEPVREPAPIPRQDEKLYPLKLAFQLTQPQATALKRFLEENGIKYTKIH